MFQSQRKKIRIAITFGPVILAVCLLAGCAAKTANIWGDPDSGLILQYRMPVNQALKYQIVTEQIQNLEVMGQAVDTEVKANTDFSAKLKGMKGNDLQLEITIDSKNISVDNAQGEITPDLSELTGKSFAMILSVLGKELELSGADAIKFELGEAGTRDVSPEFQAVFPDLAEKPVKVGDTWTSHDTILEKTDQAEIQIKLESLNTLAGFETVEGKECIKVTAKVTGTFAGEGAQQGMDFTMSAEITGTETWYFAYKEGVFVSSQVDVVGEGSIEISSQNLSIPLTQTTYIKTSLLK